MNAAIRIGSLRVVKGGRPVLDDVTANTKGVWSGQLRRDIAVVVGFILASLLLGALTIRRREA